MAQIGPAFKASLDANMPKPVVGDGYTVKVRTRSAVRYTEGGRQITMFSDLVTRTTEPLSGGFIARVLGQWLGKYCLGVYVEQPLRWDNDEVTEIPAAHETLILSRVESALRERSSCYKIDRGPNQQHGGFDGR